MERRSIILWLFICAVQAGGVMAQTEPDVFPNWQWIDIGRGVGKFGLHLLDWDGDGLMEVITTARPSEQYDGNQYAVILQSTESGRLNLVWASQLYKKTAVRGIVPVPAQHGNPPYLMIVARGEEIEVTGRYIEVPSFDLINGRTMRPAEHVVLTSSYEGEVWGATGGFLDQNSQPDLGLFVNRKSPAGPWEPRLEFYERDFFGRWQLVADLSAELISRTSVADYDGDGSLEVVFSGPAADQGYMIDGTTYRADWIYQGGFGEQTTAEDIDTDGLPEIIGLRSWSGVTVFDGDLHTPKFEFNAVGPLGGIAAGTLVPGRHKQIVTGPANCAGLLRGYDCLTGIQLWETPPLEGSVISMALGDPDNDDVPEIVCATNGEYGLFMAQDTPPVTEWAWPQLDSPFSAATGDIDGDGRLEVVGLSRSSKNGSGGCVPVVFDTAQGNIEWLPDAPPFGSAVGYAVTIADSDLDGELEILCAIGRGSQGSVVVLNPITHDIEWETPLEPNPLLSVCVADCDDDLSPEIIAGGTTGRVVIYNGVNHQFEWRSVYTYLPITDIDVADCDVDADPEIMFVNYGGALQVYDGKTKTLEWQYFNADEPVASAAFGKIDGDPALEMIIGTANAKAFVYDGETKTHQATYGFPLADPRDNFPVTGACAYDGSLTDSPIICLGGTYPIGFYPDGALAFTGAAVGEEFGHHNSMIVEDIDGDGIIDLLCGTLQGVHQFPIPDQPPTPTPEFSTPTSLPTAGTPEISATPTPPPGTSPTTTPTLTTTPAPTTPTPVASGTATPAPTHPQMVTFTLSLNQQEFRPLDQFRLSGRLTGGPYDTTVDLYIVLDVYSQYYFYPSWEQEITFARIEIEHYWDVTLDIFNFAWPRNVGQASGLWFYGIICEPGTYNLVANYSSIAFSYGE